MSAIVDESKKTGIDTVSGGKVWMPPSVTQGKKRKWNNDIFIPIIFVFAFLYGGSIVALMQNIRGITHVSAPTVPTRIAAHDFLGYDTTEIGFFVFFLLVAIICLFHTKPWWVAFLVAVIIVGPAIGTVAINGKTADINAWAEQYGYKFNATIIPVNYQTKAAMNLETGGDEAVSFSKVDGNIVLNVESTNTTVPAEALSEFNEIKVIIEDGEPVLIDEETGKKYILEPKTD